MESMISFDEEIAIALNQPANVVHLGRRKSIIESEGNQPEPELHFQVFARNVNVRRFVRFAALEMEPVWADPQDRRHLPYSAVRRSRHQSETASNKADDRLRFRTRPALRRR